MFFSWVKNRQRANAAAGEGDEIINCSKLLVEFLSTKLVSLTNRVQLPAFYFSFSRDAAPKELANCY